MRVPSFLRLALPALALLTGPMRAGVPPELPFQAAVKTAAGLPLPDTPVSVTFTVYTTAGAALWTNTQTLTPSRGTITTQIPVPDSAAFDQPYTVGIKIGNDPEMKPRLPLAATPYALALPNVTVDRASGAVGIGIAPGAGALLSVGGKIRSTNGGFQFPDGTVQATAELAGPSGPQGPRGPRGPAAGEFEAPPDSALAGLTLRLAVDGVVSKGPVRLARPFNITITVVRHRTPGGEPLLKEPGDLNWGPLVLRRPLDSTDKTWFDWASFDSQGLAGKHNAELRLVDSQNRAQATWAFANCYASAYRVLLGDDGAPTEEVTLVPQAMVRTMSLTRSPKAGPVGAGRVNLFFAAQGMSRALVLGGAGRAAPVTIIRSAGQPPRLQLGTYETDDMVVHLALTRLPDYYPWFDSWLQGNQDRRDGTVVVNDSDRGDLVSISVSGAWPFGYSLVPAGDGGVVEDYAITSEMLTRP